MLIGVALSSKTKSWSATPLSLVNVVRTAEAGAAKTATRAVASESAMTGAARRPHFARSDGHRATAMERTTS